MINQVDADQMLLISQPNSSFYTSLAVSNEGESKSRRRRKKQNKAETMNEICMRKRKLSEEQVKMLELNFGNEHKLESERKDKIAAELGLDPRQVAVWFQNRRVRWKSQKLEEEYSKMKMENEGFIVENGQLKAEVLKLKEQLIEAKKELQKLSEEGISNGSPNSSFSTTPSFMGDGFENMFYLPEDNYAPGMEWVDLYGFM